MDARLDGDDRIVTFFNGATVRELFVDLDDETRRLVWSVVDGPYSHHNASAQVFPDGADRTRFAWIADVLPNSAAPQLAQLMQRGLGCSSAPSRTDRGSPPHVAAPAPDPGLSRHTSRYVWPTMFGWQAK